MALCSVLGVCLFLTAFQVQAEEQTLPNQVVAEQATVLEQGEQTLQITPRGAAAPVTGLYIYDKRINSSNGHYEIVVKVTGYGRVAGWIDNKSITYTNSRAFGYPTVAGFYYTYDCGVLDSSVSHLFEFRATSYNMPWNTEYITHNFSL